MAQKRLEATEEPQRRDTRDWIPECQELETRVPVTFPSSVWNARGLLVMTYVLKTSTVQS